MDEKKKTVSVLDIAEMVVGSMAKLGTMLIFNDAINAVTRPGVKPAGKLCRAAGSYALEGLISDKIEDYISSQFDQVRWVLGAFVEANTD